jgi:hypothetical protein
MGDKLEYLRTIISDCDGIGSVLSDVQTMKITLEKAIDEIKYPVGGRTGIRLYN